MKKHPLSARLIISACLSLFPISVFASQFVEMPEKTKTAVSEGAPSIQNSDPSRAKIEDFQALYLKDYKQSNQIIDSKRPDMNNKPIRGFFSADLNSKFSHGSFELVNLLIVDGVYHLLVRVEYNNILEYRHRYKDVNAIPDNLLKEEQATLLVNLETGSVIQDDETNKTKVYNYLKSAKTIVEVPAITGERTAIFMAHKEPDTQYCAEKIYRGCHNPTFYDTGYHLGENKYAFYTSDTSYEPVKNNPLYIGFYRYANKDSSALAKTPFLPPETLIVNKPVRVRLNQPTIYIDSKPIPADFVSDIYALWSLDQNRRYLVSFGDSHPFLFLIMDGGKGLNIPENQFEGLNFVPYAEAYAKFGKYTDYRKRADDLSNWLNTRKHAKK